MSLFSFIEIVGNTLSSMNNPIIELEKTPLKLENKYSLTGYDTIILEHTQIEEDKDWILLVLGGPHNDSSSSYCQDLIRQLNKDYNIGIANHRGQHTKFTSLITTNHFDIEPLHLCVSYLSTRYAKSIYLAGFSLGSHIVTRYLGTNKDIPNCVKKGISICNYFDVMVQLSQIQKCVWFELYVIKRSNDLIDKLKKDLDDDKITSGIKYISSIKELFDLDMELHPDYNRLPIEERYLKYSKNSCINVMNNIKIPFLVINAKDDPLTPSYFLEQVKNSVSNENIEFHFTKRGSHLAYPDWFISESIKSYIKE